MKTTVVNIHHQKYDVLIDRRTMFGNPYRMHNMSLEERRRVTSLFKERFDKRIKNDPAFRRAVCGLRGLRLG